MNGTTILQYLTFCTLLFCGNVTSWGIGRPHRQLTSLKMQDASESQEAVPYERSMIPSRKDICRTYITGVIGTDPRVTYLANGHYVVNFALATTGHFSAQHEWERYKPTDTMWLSTEMWDTQAKQGIASGLIAKGSRFGGMGHLIFNKWVDKTTGEDRKQFKLRVLQVMSREEMEEMESLTYEVPLNMPLDEADGFPILDDQTQEPDAPAPAAPVTQPAAPTQPTQPTQSAQHSMDQSPAEGVWGTPPTGRSDSTDGMEDSERDPRIPF